MGEQAVVGVYESLAEAENAVRSLSDGGFPIQQVEWAHKILTDSGADHLDLHAPETAQPAGVAG
jgi:hypothetical protein